MIRSVGTYTDLIQLHHSNIIRSITFSVSCFLFASKSSKLVHRQKREKRAYQGSRQDIKLTITMTQPFLSENNLTTAWHRGKTVMSDLILRSLFLSSSYFLFVLVIPVRFILMIAHLLFLFFSTSLVSENAPQRKKQTVSPPGR